MKKLRNPRRRTLGARRRWSGLAGLVVIVLVALLSGTTLDGRDPRIQANSSLGDLRAGSNVGSVQSVAGSSTSAGTFDETPQPGRLQRDPSVVRAKLDGKSNRLAHGGKKKPQHPGELAEWRFRQRADENGEISPTALLEAKAHLDAMRSDVEDAGLWSWDWLGPGNIGGRVRAILTDPRDPRDLLIGSVAGGIWRSTNKGSSWTPINDFLPSLAVTSLVRSSQSPNTLYAATGEGFGNIDALPGAGIFRSDDNGTTWTSLSATTGWSFVNRLAAHPTQGQTLYAAVVVGGNGRVYRSTNGGSSWSIVLTTTGRALDVEIDPADGDRVLVGSDGNVYFSTDGGDNWTVETTGTANKLPTGGGRCEVSFTPDVSTLFVCMEQNGGEIWRSKDRGNTWALRSTGTNYMSGQGWYDNAIWVDPSSANALIVGGIDLWRSTDGGATLTKISDWRDYHNPGNSAHADQHIIVPASDYFQTKQVYVGNDGGIQLANDIFSIQENDWINLANGLGITQFYGAASSPDGSIIVGGAQDNDHLRFTGGVNSWYQAETGDGGYAAVDFTDSDIIYSEFVRLQIEKSTNGGDSYFDVDTGIGDAGTNNALFIAPFRMDPNDNNTLVAGGSSLWKTEDAANSWSSVRSPIAGSPRCSAMEIGVDGSDYWVGYENGRVSKSTNGGSSWTDVDNNGVGLPNRYVTDIAVDPTNNKRVMVTFGGYNTGNVWYSSNGGDTWGDRSGTAPYDLPALQVNTVVFHPANTSWVYIGTDLGVMASEDSGLNWNVTPLYEDNEGPAYTETSDLFFYGGEYLIAATHGRGMYRSRPLPVVFVDGSVSVSGDGSQSSPYKTIGEAESKRGPGSTVSVRANNYGEGPITLGKRGRYVATGGTVRIH